MNKWSSKSERNLSTCHPDLQTIANRVLQIHDCSCQEGYRGKEKQNNYFRKGTSKVRYPNGKHNKKPSLAMDLAPYKKGHSPWDREDTLFFAGIVMAVADELYRAKKIKHRLKWGGTWSTKADATFSFDRAGFYDAIHWELVT